MALLKFRLVGGGHYYKPAETPNGEPKIQIIDINDEVEAGTVYVARKKAKILVRQYLEKFSLLPDYRINVGLLMVEPNKETGSVWSATHTDAYKGTASTLA